MRVFQINILLLTLCNSFFKGRGPGIYSGAFFFMSPRFSVSQTGFSDRSKKSGHALLEVATGDASQ